MKTTPTPLLLICLTLAAAFAQAESPYAAYKNGPPTSDDYFPIGVWLQDPANAAKYKAIGINMYVALWRGPTEAQLATLEKAEVKVICSPKMAFKESKVIVGWMHGDEP